MSQRFSSSFHFNSWKRIKKIHWSIKNRNNFFPVDKQSTPENEEMKKILGITFVKSFGKKDYNRVIAQSNYLFSCPSLCLLLAKLCHVEEKQEKWLEIM
jgi:hypothetical protein